MKKFLLAFTVFAALTSFAATDPAKIESRYCGAPPRDASGVILRRDDVVYAFRKAHPCPATQLTIGACPGWAIDHVIPLACGGCDIVSNMQWLPVETKSSATPVAKDRWERSVYANSKLYNGPACVAKSVTK